VWPWRRSTMWPPPPLPDFMSVQRDLAYGGAASRRLPDGGSLTSWGAAVHGEEGMVVQLLKRVRMPSSIAAPVGVIFLVRGNGGGVSRFVVSRGNLRSGGCYH
jgi:hypothetical protein